MPQPISSVSLYTHIHSFPAGLNPLDTFKALYRPTQPTFLFEGQADDGTRGRLSLVGLDPPLEVMARGHNCTLRVLTPRGQALLKTVASHFASYITHSSEALLELQFPAAQAGLQGPEAQRLRQPLPGAVLRFMLDHWASGERSFAGLYGAFGYRFTYPYENLPRAPKPDGGLGAPDFRLFWVDTVLFFNLLLGESRLYVTRPSADDAHHTAQQLLAQMAAAVPFEPQTPCVSEVSLTPTPEQFLAQVAQALDLFRQGELLELVLSRRLTARCQGHPLGLYLAYRLHNPAPYLFYLDMGDEVLLGASPEMMVRVEGRHVTLRPISGTAPRGQDAVEDHRLMLQLLNNPKEKSELDMLIDLGRNDLARVCKPGVRVDHYREVEHYTRVMHTVAQVSGELEDDYNGFDALVASMNAGTLTGAPKLAAMEHIEHMETHHRGYYGGAVGYCLFSGDVNTAIVIRSAHIRGEALEYLAGATLLVESQPELELNEVRLKMQAFQDVLSRFTAQPQAA